MSKNTISGLLAVVLGASYLILTLRLPHQTMGDPLGPKVFPLIIGIATLILGIALLIREKLISNEKKEILQMKMTQSVKALIFRIGLTSIFGVIYGFLLDPLGYLISTFIFMVLLMFVINKLERIMESLIVSVGFSIVTYVSFGMLLKLSLPRGILYF